MPRTPDEVLELAAEVKKIRETDAVRLDLIYQYLRDDPEERLLGGLPADAPQDVKRLARLSRVNLLKYVVAARVQGMYVEGFQTPTAPGNLEPWEVWQRNRFDARQIGVHRSGLSYGASYVTVLPGEPVPVVRGASPRDLTVAWGDDDDWPRAALQKRRHGRWRLIDDEAVYELTDRSGSGFDVVDGGVSLHEATYDGEPVCPVVRFRDTDDLDSPVRGVVEPHMALQDQINITTFGLQVAQHYGAFRQRYIIGWLAKTEQEALKMGAARVMTFDDQPSDVSVGEFAQTDLRGYIESREATIRHLATISQTPVHELLGELVNLSAEALEAARASHHAAVDENRVMAGEAWEQALNLAGEMMGEKVDPMAAVLWRDTRVRSLNEAATAFGALVRDLGVPPRELWKRIPGISQHEIEAWIAAADADPDPFTDLERMLDRQASGQPAPAAA
jgi:hypothetical protein